MIKRCRLWLIIVLISSIKVSLSSCSIETHYNQELIIHTHLNVSLVDRYTYIEIEEAEEFLLAVSPVLLADVHLCTSRNQRERGRETEREMREIVVL